MMGFTAMEHPVVRIFTCGPSIYARPHIGNYRTFLFEDILVRYLGFKGYVVERAMNLTDVEDRAIDLSVKKGSAPRALDLVSSIVSDFEMSMDRDLDVKGAFDGLSKTIHGLERYKSRGELTGEDALRAIEEVKRSDSVLRFIFPSGE